MTEFIVSVNSLESEQVSVIATAIRNSLLYGGYGWRDVTVRKYDPQNEVRTAKISAIKRVRELLCCSLRDAKFLTDVAEWRGESGFSGVKVDYLSDLGFRVVDER